MCLHIKATRVPKPRTARRDIYAFKVLDLFSEGTSGAQARSPYRDFHYRLNKVYYATLGPPQELILRGFNHIGQYAVHKGIHCFIEFEDAANAARGENSYVFVCVIPKGSKYYTGTFEGEEANYTSDAMMVLDRNHPESLKRLANLPSKQV